MCKLIIDGLRTLRVMHIKSDDIIGVHDGYCCNIISGYLCVCISYIETGSKISMGKDMEISIKLHKCVFSIEIIKMLV